MKILKKEILHNNYCQQHDHAAVLSLLNHFYFESFLVTYDIVYIFVYIFMKLAIFILFCCLQLYVFSALLAEHFEIWKNILWNWWVNCFIARSIKWCDISGCLYWIHFPFYGVFLFQEYCVSLGLLISCLSLSQSA